MRYRRLEYRYTLIQRAPWPAAPTSWGGDLLSFALGRARWTPHADVCETSGTIEVLVELAGVQEDDVEIQLFENALVVEGQRHFPGCADGAVYHAVGIRQGPFRLELPLPAPVEPDGVEGRYERGLLQITLRKLGARG